MIPYALDIRRAKKDGSRLVSSIGHYDTWQEIDGRLIVD